jgi:hypothetical protein
MAFEIIDKIYLNKNLCRFLRQFNCTSLIKLKVKTINLLNGFLFIKIFESAYLLPFTYTPDDRKKKFLFSDAWAIAEAFA